MEPASRKPKITGSDKKKISHCQCSGSEYGIRCLFDPWIQDPGSGMGKKSRSGSGINIPNHISESLETIFVSKIQKFFKADPDPGSEIFLTLDPGWKNSGPG
jgi:hypothetical protein